MFPHILMVLTSMAIGADSFEGTKAGEAKELAPGIVFHWCPAGTFEMGSPKPKSDDPADGKVPINVRFSSGFWLGETEVTQGQWQLLMRTTPWKGKSDVKVGEQFAASYISHEDAVKFCQKLTTEEQRAGRLPASWRYSLPTEAQWEFACKAGTTTNFSFGDDESNLDEYGWFEENGSKIGGSYPHLVGQKKSNPWGLKDMHGNVWEWCSDWLAWDLTGGRDPVGPASGAFRVIKGGCWDDNAIDCGSANRYCYVPTNRFNYLGFRAAAVPK